MGQNWFHNNCNPTSLRQLDSIAEEDRTLGDDVLIRIVRNKNLVEQQMNVYCVQCCKTFKSMKNLKLHQARFIRRLNGQAMVTQSVIMKKVMYAFHAAVVTKQRDSRENT